MEIASPISFMAALCRPSRLPSMLEQLGGASPLSSLMERRISEAQGRRREAGSEGSVEQSRDPMDKNRIPRLVRPDERAGNAKSVPSKAWAVDSAGVRRR